jgi:hypothetical protein
MKRSEQDARNLYNPDGPVGKKDRAKKGVRTDAKVGADAKAASSRSRGGMVKTDTSPELQRGRRSASSSGRVKNQTANSGQQKNAKHAPRDKSFGSTSRSRDASFSKKEKNEKEKEPSISDFDSAMDNIKKLREGLVSSPSHSPPKSYKASAGVDMGRSRRVDSKGDLAIERGRESLSSSIDSKDEMRSRVDRLVVENDNPKWGSAPLNTWSLEPSPIWKQDSFSRSNNWGSRE